jgi:hypothetical protein
MSLHPSIKRVAAIVAGAAVLFPAVSYFLKTSPPFFPELSSVVTTLVAIGVVTVSGCGFYRPGENARAGVTSRYAICALVAAVGSALAYGLFLNLCSVAPPSPWDGEERAQIGFGTATWSLTSKTQEWVAMQPDPPSSEQLMMERGGWADGGVYKIWQPWTVYAAATLLACLFFIATILWTLGWSLLAVAIGDNNANGRSAAPVLDATNSRWETLVEELPDFAEDLGALGRLLTMNPLDPGSSLNKMRCITERVLHSLCARRGISWGQGEPTLERMIGPLVAAGALPKNVSLHVRTIQTNASPGSHYQESRLSPGHIRIAESALMELLEWIKESGANDGPMISMPNDPKSQTARVPPSTSG